MELKVILMIYDICVGYNQNHFNELSKCLDNFEFIGNVDSMVWWEANTKPLNACIFQYSAYLPLALTYHHRILCMHPWILYGNIKRITIEQQILQYHWADKLQRIEFHCVVSQAECATLFDFCVFAYGPSSFSSFFSLQLLRLLAPFISLTHSLALHIIRNKNKQTNVDRTERSKKKSQSSYTKHCNRKLIAFT